MAAKLRPVQEDSDVATAEQAVTQAEARLREFLFEEAVDGAGSSAKAAERKRLGEAVRIARERVQAARNATAEAAELNQQLGAVNHRIHDLLIGIVVAEGLRLGQLYQEHARAALHAEQAVKALADWMVNFGNAGPQSVQLREAVWLLPMPSSVDPGRFDRAKRALDASLNAFAAEWAGFPAQLLANAHVNGPSLEERQA